MPRSPLNDDVDDVAAGLAALRADVREAAELVCTPEELETLGLRAGGLSYRRIASRLGVSAPRVRQRLELADRKIRWRLHGELLGFAAAGSGRPWASRGWVLPVAADRIARGWVSAWDDETPELGAEPPGDSASGKATKPDLGGRSGRGRKPKLSGEARERVLAAIADGATVRGEAAAAGVDETTYYRWLARGTAGMPPYGEFRAAVLAAREAYVPPWQRERAQRLKEDEQQVGAVIAAALARLRPIR